MSSLAERMKASMKIGGEEKTGDKGQASAMMERMREDQIDKDSLVLLISQIDVKPQARKTFKDIDVLAANIEEHGQLQPIIVIQTAPYRYELAYGERRLRAIRDVLKQDTILARVKRDIKDAVSLRLSQLSENIHRAEYEPLDLAEEFSFLMDQNKWTQTDLAKKVGVTQSWVSKKLSLLEAPEDVQAKIRSGEIAETDYYNNKETVKATVATGKEKSETKPAAPKSVSVPMDLAIEIAEIFKIIGSKHGLNDLEISPEPSKKELQAIMARASEIKGVM
jgi:ParB/RepB/Spo0J family partition protein